MPSGSLSFRAFARSCCVAAAAAVAACGGTGSGLLAVAGSADAATVRFVNATATPLDLATGGTVPATHANIASGQGVACFSVPDPTVSGLSVRLAGTSADLAGFAPTFSGGGRFTVVAYPGTAGAVQFVTIPTAATPAAGRSLLRVFDGATTLGQVDLYLSTPGAALGIPTVSGLGAGLTSGALDVAAGATQVRLTNTATTTVVLDAGSQVLEAGKSYTLIVSSATAAILVPDC